MTILEIAGWGLLGAGSAGAIVGILFLAWIGYVAITWPN
jgi:hypothetical protein